MRWFDFVATTWLMETASINLSKVTAKASGTSAVIVSKATPWGNAIMAPVKPVIISALLLNSN